tara:strand:- start:1258 stop:1596 length:339 start_codon:yes stop_codon:yes gene_type:complete
MAYTASLQIVFDSEICRPAVTDDKGLRKRIIRDSGTERVEISIDESFAISNDSDVLPPPACRELVDGEAATFGAGFNGSRQDSFQLLDILPFGLPGRLATSRAVTRALVQEF